MDPDELDDDDVIQLEQRAANGHHDPGSGGARGQSLPLLVGLVDSHHARRSLEALRNSLETDDVHIDLEELAKKRLAGGGLLDSVANMANSILGAGTFSSIYSGMSLTFLQV